MMKRRHFLPLSLVCFTALPAQWKTPVVSSVMLPAHAQTSPEADDSDDDDSRNCSTGPTQTLTASCEDDDFATTVCYEICEPFTGTRSDVFSQVSCPGVERSNVLTVAVGRTSILDIVEYFIGAAGDQCGGFGARSGQLDCGDGPTTTTDISIFLEDIEGNCYVAETTVERQAGTGLTVNPFTATRII